MLRLKSINDPLNERTDVLHYRLDFDVNPESETINGSNTMTVRALTGGVTAFHFWLHTALRITEVEVDGKGAVWRRLDAEVIEVSGPVDAVEFSTIGTRRASRRTAPR